MTDLNIDLPKRFVAQERGEGHGQHDMIHFPPTDVDLIRGKDQNIPLELRCLYRRKGRLAHLGSFVSCNYNKIL